MIRCLLLGMVAWMGAGVYAQELRLGIPLSHSLSPTQLAVSPDGKMAASGSPDRSILLRETESGKSLHRLQGHQAAVSGLLFLDNQRLLSWSADGTLKIWNIRGPKAGLLHRLEEHRSPVSMALPLGDKIISGDASGRIVFWDTAKAAVVEVLAAHAGPLLALQVLPDGKVFSAAAQDGWKIWSFDGPKAAVLLQQQGPLPRNTRLATVAADGSVLLCTDRAEMSVLRYENGQLNSDAAWSALPVSEAERNRFTPMHAFRRKDGSWIFFSGGAVVERNVSGQLRLVSEKPYARLLHATYDPLANQCWYSYNDGVIYSLGTRPERPCYTSTAEALPEQLIYERDRLLCLFGGRFTAIDTLGTFLYRESDPAPLSMLSGVLPEKGWFYTVATDHRIRIWDPDNGKLLQMLRGHTGSVLDVASDSSGNYLFSGGRDGKALIWDVPTGALLASYTFTSAVTDVCAGYATGSAYAVLANGTLHYLTSSRGLVRLAAARQNNAWPQLAMNRKANQLLVWDGEGRCELYNYATQKRRDLYASAPGLNASALLQEGAVLAYNDGRILYNPYKQFRKPQTLLQLPSPILHMVALGGDTLACATKDGSIHLLSIRRGLILSKKRHGNAIIGLSVSGQRLASADESGRCAVQTWNRDTAAVYMQYTGGLMSAMLFREGQYLLLAGMDQLLALHDAVDAHAYLRLLPLSGAGRDWITLHRSGLFDATEGAMENMYWIRGERILEFARLKARFWEPGLWSQVVQRQKLRDVQGFDRIGMHPDVRFGETESGLLPIRLQRNDGGIGRVAVYINGKEISADARGPGFNAQADSAELKIDLRRHPFLIPGQDNEIMVKTWTADGLVESRGAVCRYTPPAASVGASRQPRFFGIVCGTGAYKNSDINLRYSVPDAQAIATGITEGANRLFGAANTTVRLFTQPGTRPGSRENLQAAFDSIAAEAKAEDIVFIYLSGHGINTGGEDGEFCYLLPEAFSADAAAYSDPKLRQRVSLGTGELSQMLNRVPALKQILIIDACGSGKALDNLAGKREIAAVQIKAFDRMRDRTGTFILSGCAADAVSYEASRYGQGLLTYALLQGMAGGSLKEAGLLDVADWFQYARDQVPGLARGIGGLQEPQMLLPRGGSIDIAQVDEAVIRKIPLARIKPVFIQSLVQDEAAFEDVLKIGEMLDRRMFELSARGVSAPIAFFEVKRFADACQLFGRYSQEDGRIVFKGKIKFPEGETAISVSDSSAEALVSQLMERISKAK